MFNRKHIKSWLLALFAAETLGVTYGLKVFPGNSALTIIYFGAGLAIGILLLFFPPFSGHLFTRRRESRPILLTKIVWALLGALVMYTLTRFWLEEISVDISYADMLPIIKVMNQRFEAGQWKQVYDTIPGIWGGVRPIYLPAMWLPYAPAVFMNLDMRWITTGGVFISFCAFLFVFRPSAGKERPFHDGSFYTAVIAFLLFWWVLSEDMPAFISMSEEGVVVCWYSLLVIALLSENAVLIGGAISLCLLSRYALIGWVPAYVLYLTLSGSSKKALIISAMGLFCLIGFFILPFGWEAFITLLRLPGNYVAFAKTVWHTNPEVFKLGPGLAKFFGPGKAAMLHILLVASSFAIPPLFVLYGLYQNKMKKTARPLSNLPLASLKISVVLFYNFIDVPYLYLFYTSSFISLMLVTVAIGSPDFPNRGELTEKTFR